MIDIKDFGKDHWSLLAYIEHINVNEKCIPDPRKMREIHGKRAPMGNPFSSSNYPTRTKKGAVYNHDDYAEDLEKVGLITIEGTGANPMYILTDYGWEVASRLRKHKAKGNNFQSFEG